MYKVHKIINNVRNQADDTSYGNKNIWQLLAVEVNQRSTTVSDGQIPNPNLTLKSQIFKTQILNPNPKIQIPPTNPNLRTPNPNQIPIPNW